MTTTIGIDLIDVGDVREALASFGDRYVRRILTSAEQMDCVRNGTIRPELVSQAFAAKEAVIKTFAGDADAVDWLDVELTRDAESGMAVSLGRSALAAAGDREPRTISVTTAQTESLVMALAVTEHQPNRPGEE